MGGVSTHLHCHRHILLATVSLQVGGSHRPVPGDDDTQVDAAEGRPGAAGRACRDNGDGWTVVKRVPKVSPSSRAVPSGPRALRNLIPKIAGGFSEPLGSYRSSARLAACT